MVRDARSWGGKSRDDREIAAGFRHPTTGKTLCQPRSKWVPFSNQGMIGQRKEKGWALPVFSCDQNTMGF